jgi:hypothetical protein
MVLLFVVVLYVYPMKFLFTVLTGMMFGHEIAGAIRSTEEMRALMQIYGLGFIALNATLALMHLHARRKGDQLRLTPAQYAEVAGSIRHHLIQALVAVLSVCIVRFTGDDGSWSGMCYLLLAPLLTLNGRWTDGRMRKAAAFA